MSPSDKAEVLQVPSTAKTRSTASQTLIDEQAAKLDAVFRRIKDDEEKLAARLDQVTDQIAMIDAKWTAGSIAIEHGRYRQEREINLKLQQEIIAQLCLLWTKSAQLPNWVDDIVPDELARDMAEDWALIDAAVRCYPELEGAKKTIKFRRTAQKQDKFRKQLYDAYECTTESNAVFVYCPISHAKVERSAVAAHIVNVNVGATTASALFGNGEEHIWNVKNGLVIHQAYEQLLDSAKAVILPASTDPMETEFKFFLLTKDLGQVQLAGVWGYEALHGRRLEFLNDFRPAKRYLYFKCIMSLLRRRRADVSGHLQDLEFLPDIAKIMWASPGPCLRNTILYRFSRELGCIGKDEANQFWGVKTDGDDLFKGRSVQDEQEVFTIATRAAKAALDTTDEDRSDDTAEVTEDTDDRFPGE